MTAASVLPPSVAALNRLLDERRAPDHALGAALGISYLVHTAAFLALALVLRHSIPADGGYQPIYAERGFIPVTPIYNPSPGAPPGPRPRAVVPPAPVPEEKPEPPLPAAKPEPVAEDDEAEVIPEKTPPRRRTPPPQKQTPAPAARAVVTPPSAAKPVPPVAEERPGGGNIPSAKGGPGSPEGTLTGHPDGGLQSLAFTDQWYVGRVRDLIYGNWQNPFLTAGRPAAALDVTVSFVILRSGQIVEASVEKSSGNAPWDRAGLRAVEGATLPPLPRGWSGSSVSVGFRFHFDPNQ